jgi:hypothetical protein
MRRAPAKRESSLFFPFFVSSTLFLFFFVLARPSITKIKKTSFYLLLLLLRPLSLFLSCKNTKPETI